MRRISMQYAQPGMVLSMDVYDYYGNIILPRGTRLTNDNAAALGKMGGGELFFDDRRVDDVPVNPLMPARIEGQAARALRALLDTGKKAAFYQSGFTKIDTDPLEKTVFSMVRQMYPVVIGEINPTGCFSLKDYDCVHPVQVAGFSIFLGRKLGFGESELTGLGMAAMLENIGYTVLPDGMISEPGALNSIETHEIHQHSHYGYQILKDFTGAAPDILAGVLGHHEQWDGSGYPFGLKGNSIPLFARIISIADVYYALVSRRPYRGRFLPHEAIEYIMAFSGAVFDPELVQLFSRVVPLYPTGVMVNLNTGERCIITGINQGYTGRPVVRVCYDKYFNELAYPYDLNLTDSEHQHRLVTDVVEY